MSLTGALLIFVTVALLFYNQFKGEHPTITKTWADAASASLVLPFIWGAWTAHLAAPHNDPESHPFILLAACFVLGVVDYLLNKGERTGIRWPIIWVFIGMPFGYFCWGNGL